MASELAGLRRAIVRHRQLSGRLDARGEHDLADEERAQAQLATSAYDAVVGRLHHLDTRGR